VAGPGGRGTNPHPRIFFSARCPGPLGIFGTRRWSKTHAEPMSKPLVKKKQTSCRSVAAFVCRSKHASPKNSLGDNRLAFFLILEKKDASTNTNFLRCGKKGSRRCDSSSHIQATKSDAKRTDVPDYYFSGEDWVSGPAAEPSLPPLLLTPKPLRFKFHSYFAHHVFERKKNCFFEATRGRLLSRRGSGTFPRHVQGVEVGLPLSFCRRSDAAQRKGETHAAHSF